MTGRRIADVDAFRKVDTSTGRVATELLLAMAGQVVAALVGRWLGHDVLELEHGTAAIAGSVAIQGSLSVLALFLTSVGRVRRNLIAQREAVLASEEAILERVAHQEFLAHVRDALEMSTNEGDAMGVVAAALDEAGGGPAELLVADASRAHLHRMVTAPGHDAPGCPVETPWGCPAIRRGRTLRFEDAASLGACPRLRERSGTVGSAVCVPVTILGTPTAVLHTTSPTPGICPSLAIERLEGIAGESGARLGVLRAMAESQLQAETDPLTGLLNRRALEDRVRLLRLEGSRFAVAMADLDHFKQLNDRYGHETGDRALRTFARVLREAVRGEDHVSRHGGEEFVVVLPGLTATTAASVIARVRDQLREAVGTALIPAFTVSAGVADSSWSSELVDVLRAADEALSEAKAAGRDRVIVHDDRPTAPAPAPEGPGTVEPPEPARP